MPTVPLPYPEGIDQLTGILNQQQQRVLLLGPVGAGKSHLAATLARELAALGQGCACLSADPGSPAFGLPTAVNLGTWQQDSWQVTACEALCSLDAARFRLPLMEAVSRLLDMSPTNLTLLIDTPGLFRGIASAELLIAMVNLTKPDHIVWLETTPSEHPLAQELASLRQPVLRIKADHRAQADSQRARAERRTRLWDAYLAIAETRVLPLTALPLLGTPPPQESPDKWPGLVVALLDAAGLIALGEVVSLEGQQLTLRVPPFSRQPQQLLVRDARRLPDEPLSTAQRCRPAQQDPLPDQLNPLAYPTLARPMVRSPQLHHEDITFELVNGLFEDPLLLIKTHWRKRCLLFDLGHTARVPLKLAHQVSHVFISHAHFDHIGGFLGLLRTRLGTPAPCCLFGPPGLGQHVAGMVSGIRWDRIGDQGPVFEIAELHGTTLKRYRLQVGIPGLHPLADQAVDSGIIHREARFQIRAVELDHGIPVLAFAYEARSVPAVDTSVLEAKQLAPGPWLGDLKAAYLANQPDTRIQLPNGTSESVGTLAKALLRSKPGERLVYATDLADSPTNRERLTRLAQGAKTLVCEAVFAQSDLKHSIDNSHLTARACAEIAAAAGVSRLLPFHFSRRYEKTPERIYTEIEAVFPRVIKLGGINDTRQAGADNQQEGH